MVARQQVLLATAMVAMARVASTEVVPVDDPVSVSIQLCNQAVHYDGAEREALLVRALALATAGVDDEPDRADAHYAVFCAAGRQLDGRRLGLGTVRAARRVRRAVERALELDPDHVDALVGKARMLLRIPDWLGGDREEARRCVERARSLAPHHPALQVPWPEVRATSVSAASP